MKYFITSDLHSFYTPVKKSLDAVKYDSANKEHTLVILGDIFDRGDETVALYNFLKSIPQERLILVKGNHEYLLDELLNKKLPDYHDYSNGTVKTCCHMAFKSLHIANKNARLLQELDYEIEYSALGSGFTSGDAVGLPDKDTISYTRRKWQNIIKRVKGSKIYNGYKNANGVHYGEIDHFVGVHSFVPVKPKQVCSCTKSKQLNAIYQGYTEWFESDANGRNAEAGPGELATGGCPYKYLEAGLFCEQGKKTIICGHYGTSEFHQHYCTTPYADCCHDIYFSKDLIALDSSVAGSRQTNVLVIDTDEQCYDQYNRKLN